MRTKEKRYNNSTRKNSLEACDVSAINRQRQVHCRGFQDLYGRIP